MKAILKLANDHAWMIHGGAVNVNIVPTWAKTMLPLAAGLYVGTIVNQLDTGKQRLLLASLQAAANGNTLTEEEIDQVMELCKFTHPTLVAKLSKMKDNLL